MTEWMKNIRLIGILLASILAFAACCELSADSVTEDDLNSLYRLWESQRSEVATIKVKQRIFRAGGASLKAVTAEELSELLGRTDLLDSDGFKRVVEQVWSRVPEEGKYWSERVIIIGNGKARVDSSVYSQVFDGDDEILSIDRGAVQEVKIGTKGDIHLRRDGLSDLRWIPPREIEDQSYESVIGDAANIELTWGGESRRPTAHMVVEKATGTVKKYWLTNSAGEVFQERLQMEVADFEGGIHFPLVSVDATYKKQEDTQDRVVGHLTISTIEELVINEDVDDSVFLVATPKETLVRDYTRGDGKVRTFTTGPEEKDIKTRISLGQVGADTHAEEVSYRWLFITINVAVCLTIVFFILRTRWGSS